ncbi:MAG: hypothetical protein WC554_04755 [Clostridia bacterium]|jgi:hypothetical protein
MSEKKENLDLISEGYFLMYKKIIKSPVWGDPLMLKLWIYCLVRANFEDKKIFFNGQFFDVKRGQFITSFNHISKDCGLTPQQTRSRINALKSTNKITVKTTNKFSLISLPNYAYYQDRQQTEQQAKQQSSNKPATNQQQQRTNIINKTNKNNLGKKFKIYEFLDEVQRKNFEDKPSWFKYKLTSPSDFEVILSSYYIFSGLVFENEWDIKRQLQKDLKTYARSLEEIRKVKDELFLKTMANLRKNGRLSLVNCASAIKYKNKIDRETSSDLSKELSDKLSMPF